MTCTVPSRAMEAEGSLQDVWINPRSSKGSDSSNDMMPERVCRHHIIFQRNAPYKSGALYSDQTIFLSAFLNE
jgi:hypothetical protein